MRMDMIFLGHWPATRPTGPQSSLDKTNAVGWSMTSGLIIISYVWREQISWQSHKRRVRMRNAKRSGWNSARRTNRYSLGSMGLRIQKALLLRYGREISGLRYYVFLRLITFPCSLHNIDYEERSFKLVDIELIIMIWIKHNCHNM